MRSVEMKVGIIGAGSVGQAIAAKLLRNGHDVKLGIRNPSPAELAKERMMARPLTDWQKDTGGQVVSFAEAAAHGEIVINATSGGVSIEALKMAGAANLKGKILIDIANPLDFSKGMPPSLLPAYDHGTSLGEEIQKAFPDTHVVKTLNTVSNTVMVEPSLVKGDHDLFVAGNDAAAKKTGETLLRKEFDWKSIIDLGDITGARATEHLLPVWIRLWSIFGTASFNIRIVKS
jgi:8-hydroxy-5-deazaflavin:NADPH oxidoreductase